MPTRPKSPARRPTHCPQCGVPEGQEHRRGCTAEVCPGCGAQAVGHRCRRAAGLPRIPFLHFPSVCARCGRLDPPWFGVPDAVWAYYVPPDERAAILCRPCFNAIVRLVDRQRPRPDGFPSAAQIAGYAALWSRFDHSPLRGPARRRLSSRLEALDAAYAAALKVKSRTAAGTSASDTR